MALVGLRGNVIKILAAPISLAGRPLLKVNINGIIPIQAAGISGSALRDKTRERPEPFPYETKRYNFWRAWLEDTTTHRFDENTKIIVVEGPIAVGKSEFAKILAKDLDMKHMKEPTLDNLYINSYGFDRRTLDHLLPPSTRSFDEKKFCENPNDLKAAGFQIQKYCLRYSQYVDALAHLLNTGQGVVLERCVYSDFVFMETMFKAGYVSKGAREVYYEVQSNSLGELMKPHLVIYLDIPVPVVQQRIKKRNLPYEVNSKALTTEFLTNMEVFYKQEYLKQISTHAQLLVYDWTDFGDAEVVVEDIERIDFDNFEKNDPKLKDWRKHREWDWNCSRIRYTDQKGDLGILLQVPRFDVPELVIDAYDAYLRDKIIKNAPGNKFEREFNPTMGDMNLLFKTKQKYYRP